MLKQIPHKTRRKQGTKVAQHNHNLTKEEDVKSTKKHIPSEKLQNLDSTRGRSSKSSKGEIVMRDEMKMALIEELKERGYEARWETVLKNGVKKEGILIGTEAVRPLVYVEDLEEESDTVSTLCEKVLRSYRIGMEETKELDRDKIMNREYLLSHLTVGVQIEGNEPIIKRASGLDGIDEYLMIADEGLIKGGMSFVKLNQQILGRAKISESEAWQAGKKNLHTEIVIRNIDVALGLPKTGVELYIITNKRGIQGGAAVLDREVMKNFAKKIGTKKIMVVPSSVHEMLLYPNGEEAYKEEYIDMVDTINQSEVKPEERLLPNVYFMYFD